MWILCTYQGFGIVLEGTAVLSIVNTVLTTGTARYTSGFVVDRSVGKYTRSNRVLHSPPEEVELGVFLMEGPPHGLWL